MTVDRNGAVSALLRAINDQIVVHEYGDGLLADLPLTYGDGDSVRLLLEPMGSGIRVSDQASAYERLLMADVNTNSGRAADAIKATIRAAGLSNVGGEDDEIATFGSTDDLGEMMLSVAQATMRVEQLRWLAVRRGALRFADRVVERVQSAAHGDWRIHRNASVVLRSGRERLVTVAVEAPKGAAYVQALSANDRDQAAEHCYYLFSWAKVPPESRVAALDGPQKGWPAQLIEELRAVADVAFFTTPRGVEDAVQRALVATAQANR